MDLDQIVTIFKAAFVRINTDLIMAALITKFPFFGLPVISSITRMLVSRVLQYGADEGELGAYFLYVNAYTKEQVKDFEKAAIKNQAAQESGNDELKKQTEKELIDAARILIKYNH